MNTDGQKNPREAADRAGLANEPRPGLGAKESDGVKPFQKGKTKRPRQDVEPLGRNAPLPETDSPPQEQDSDSLAQQQQRSTGVSGHSGAA